MVHLPVPELVLFLSAGVLCAGAALIGYMQLRPTGQAYARLLVPLICLATCLEVIILVMRAVEAQAVPLTGLFESMLVLIIVFNLLYILLSIAVTQIWFSSVMVWMIFGLALLTGMVAEPATESAKVEVTPWVVFHSVAMVISIACITFSMVAGSLFLVTSNRLKHKKVTKVLGRVPSIHWLQASLLLGVKGCFVTLSVGLASGIGLVIWTKAAAPDMGLQDWFVDPKMVVVACAWLLIAFIWVLHALGMVKEKALAYSSLLAFFLMIFALVGVPLFCGTQHSFT